MSEIKAFLSYARLDNDDKRVAKFKAALEVLVKQISGRPFTIFLDNQIEVGDLWEARIYKELDAASVLIVIMTPTFFTRKWCTDEVQIFLDRHEKTGVEPILMPIYWLKTPQVENPDMLGAHPIASRVKKHQYDNWLALFRKSMEHDDVREQLIDLAEKIENKLKVLEALPVTPIPVVVAPPVVLPTSTSTSLKPRGGRKIYPAPRKRVRTKVLETPKIFSVPLTLEDYKAHLITIPAGEFIRGSEIDDDEKPQTTIKLSKFQMGIVPVTVGMYEEYCQKKKLKMPDAPDFDKSWERKTHPMVNVTWDDASAYATWAGLALPTEAQWERAARSTDGREYPWRKDWLPENLHWNGNKDRFGGGTAPVGSYPGGKSVDGVLDMAGNVWEWCEDRYQADWYAKAKQSDPPGPPDGDRRVLRGGSWRLSGPAIFRCALRNGGNPGIGGNLRGFRLASPGPVS